MSETFYNMQSPHFDTTPYLGQLVGPTLGLNSSAARLHPTNYSRDLEVGSFHNYDTQGTCTLHDYGDYDQTTYTEPSTPFSSGFIFPNAADSPCYKTSTRGMDLADFTMARQEDIRVVTPTQSFSLSSPPNVYNQYTTHMLIDQPHYHHHHHHYQHQLQPHYKHQLSHDSTSRTNLSAKLAQQPSPILSKNSFKMETMNVQPYPPETNISKSLNSSTVSQSPTNFRNIQEGSSSTNHHFTASSCDQAILTNSHLQDRKPDISVNKSQENTTSIPIMTEESEDTSKLDSKPTMSYIALIAKAILESEQRRLSLGSIYTWIEKNYPFYKNKSQGWRNSVRHNLSLNYCFIKSGRCEDGKGNYWAIHPANLQDFMRGDFRQRRRSRRRGKKRDCDLNIVQVQNGYLQSPSMQLTSGINLHPSDLGPTHSPYTEAERSAYRLDEALFRQRMSSPFLKWYQDGVAAPGCGIPTSQPACSAGTCANLSPAFWSQAYNDSGNHVVYPALGSTIPR